MACPYLSQFSIADQHLTVGLPSIIARYEESEGAHRSSESLWIEKAWQRSSWPVSMRRAGPVVTILQTTQYRDLLSFSDVGTFAPLSTDAHGKVIRKVAPARIALSREDHRDAPLCLQITLIHDLRRTVLVQPDPEEALFPSRWDSDLPLDERTWWREGWQATAAPAKKTTAKLIPIVTTEVSPTIDQGLTVFCMTSAQQECNGKPPSLVEGEHLIVF